MLSHYGYMQSTTAYQDLHDFFTQELNVAALDAHYWCQYIYEFENSNTDGNTSELIQKLQANIPDWNNYSHLGRLSVLLQNARNSATRMFCLGGHTPNETIKLLRDAQQAAQQNTRVGAKAKRFILTTPVPAAAVKSIKNAAVKTLSSRLSFSVRRNYNEKIFSR